MVDGHALARSETVHLPLTLADAETVFLTVLHLSHPWLSFAKINLIMASLWAGHYTAAVVSIFFFFFLLSSSPNLSGRRLDVYHTSTHGVALERI